MALLAALVTAAVLPGFTAFATGPNGGAVLAGTFPGAARPGYVYLPPGYTPTHRYPVVYDVTHSLQLPGAGDGVTAGQAQFIEPLASAGVAAGVDGVFLEVHERPESAMSDAQNALRLDLLEPLLARLVRLHEIAHQAVV